jgi:hypothetical protein
VPLPPAREAELAAQRKKRRSDGGEYRAMVPLVGIVWMGKTGFEAGRKRSVASRDENGTDIFRRYSRPNSFRGVLIRPYPSPDI